MDPNRLDDLARVFGSGQSRRRILKTLAGGVLAAAAGVVGFDATEAAARKRANGAVCSKNADCQSGDCLPKDHTGSRLCGCTPDPTNVTCGTLCGPQVNNCGQTVECAACCVPNGGACDLGNPGACCSQTCCNFGNSGPIPQCCF